MSIQDLGSIGELIAALATLATLIYLAIKMPPSKSRQQARHVPGPLESDGSLKRYVLSRC